MSLVRPRLARAAATLVRQPYLQNVQRDRASILWTTLEPGDGRVVIGLADGTTFTVPAASRALPSTVTGLSYAFYQFQADVTGLQPGTEYAYRITLNGATLTSKPGYFRTAAPGPFSFLVFGDSGEDTPQQRAIIPLMGAETGVSFLLHTGDLAYPQGSFALYESNYFGLNAVLFGCLPVFPTPGNHDYMVDSAAPFVASHALPQSGVNPADAGRYYSYDWGDVHFASIDSNLMPATAADRMLAWLDNDLGSARNFWKIVFFHHPPYPTGHHLGDPICADVRARVNPIVERHGVQLVLSGHEHGYERTAPLIADQPVQPGGGTTYVISGGGGADLHDVNPGGATAVALQAYNYLRIDVDGTALTVRATGVDGSEIDRVVIRPLPVISERGVVSIGDYSQALAPGSLVSIFGQNLALKPQSASEVPLPAELGGVRVRLDDDDVPLFYVSPQQINVQIPYDAKASCVLQVLTDNGAAQADLSISPTAPSILAVTNAPGAASSVIVYATGLGACAQALAAGSTLSAPAQVVAPVSVWLGDTQVQPSFAGLTPQFAGLYQVNFTIPAGTAVGTYPLRIATSNGSSRPVPLDVR